jgi:hypothetical protein
MIFLLAGGLTPARDKSHLVRSDARKDQHDRDQENMNRRQWSLVKSNATQPKVSEFPGARHRRCPPNLFRAMLACRRVYVRLVACPSLARSQGTATVWI